MSRLSIIAAGVLLASLCPQASAQTSNGNWGVRGSLGLSTGDLKDTTNNTPGLGLGGFYEYRLTDKQAIQARLDGLLFRSAHRQTTGVSAGTPWTRDLDNQVAAWMLGAEYLMQPIHDQPRLRVGGGLHLVRWVVNDTSRLSLSVGGGPGTVLESSNPTWTKVGLSLVANYRLSPHLSAEARVLSSSYGWQGERVQVAQVGLSWSF